MYKLKKDLKMKKGDLIGVDLGSDICEEVKEDGEALRYVVTHFDFYTAIR